MKTLLFLFACLLSISAVAGSVDRFGNSLSPEQIRFRQDLDKALASQSNGSAAEIREKLEFLFDYYSYPISKILDVMYRADQHENLSREDMTWIMAINENMDAGLYMQLMSQLHAAHTEIFRSLLSDPLGLVVLLAQEENKRSLFSDSQFKLTQKFSTEVRNTRSKTFVEFFDKALAPLMNDLRNKGFLRRFDLTQLGWVAKGAKDYFVLAASEPILTADFRIPTSSIRWLSCKEFITLQK